MPYIAAEIIIQVVEETDSADSDDINEALTGLSYEGHIFVVGAVEFDNQGRNVNVPGPVSQVQDLPVRVVYPEEYTETEPQI